MGRLTWAVSAAAVAECCVRPGHAAPPAEFFNEFDWAPTEPTPGPTDFEIVFAGNAVCQIPQQNQHDSGTDPFPNPNPITVTYNSAANTTTVTYSGGNLKPRKRYHFGLNQGYAPTPSLQAVSKVWTYAEANPAPLPILNVIVPPPGASTTKPKYTIIHLEAAFAPSGQTYGSWYEMPYTPSPGRATTEQPEVTYSNAGTQTLYISNPGIQIALPVPNSSACLKLPTCPANQKLLDKLDFKKTPPPGQPGSKFITMTNPPPAVLAPTTVSNPSACP